MSALAVKEEKRCSNVVLVETSEQSSTVVGSQQNSEEWKRPKEISEQARPNFNRENNLVSHKVPEYVCFIGKFPKNATRDDIQNFVKSKGINFTGVRVGPKKKPNANVFGYVDLPTKEDYEKLLALNRSLYRGRRIRIDHATPKIPSPHRKIMQPRRVNPGIDFDSAEENKPIPPYDRGLVLKLVKLHAALLAKTEVQVNPLIPLNPLSDSTRIAREPTEHSQKFEITPITPKKKQGKFGSNKQTARSKRYALERSKNRGRRKDQHFRLSSRKTGTPLTPGQNSSGHSFVGRGSSHRLNSSKVAGLQNAVKVASVPNQYEE